jgi:hypothetical protein
MRCNLQLPREHCPNFFCITTERRCYRFDGRTRIVIQQTEARVQGQRCDEMGRNLFFWTGKIRPFEISAGNSNSYLGGTSFQHEPDEMAQCRPSYSNQKVEEDVNARAESRQPASMGLESDSSVRFSMNVVQLFNHHALGFRPYRWHPTLKIGRNTSDRPDRRVQAATLW